MRHQQDDQAGFTLIEVLVCLALFSLMLGCFGAIFYRLETTKKVFGRIERLENVDLVRRYVQRSLEGTLASSSVDANGIRTIRFVGEPSRVVFVGIAAGDRETGGLYETEVWLDSDGRLLQKRRPLGWGREMKVEAEILLEDLDSLTFSYSPCPIERKGFDAHHWAKTDQLPFMISVMAKFKSRDAREWRNISAFMPTSACAFAL